MSSRFYTLILSELLSPVYHGCLKVSLKIEVAPTKSLVTEESVKEEFLEQTKITGEPGAQVTTTEQVSEQMTATTTSGAEVLESKVDETAKLEESQKVETQQKIEVDSSNFGSNYEELRAL